jgi:predicted  nucleic acid-binding Zn-ribbon protein
VHQDLEALLALQAEDAIVDDLERRLAALTPRLQDLDRQRQIAEDALRRAESAAEADERKRRELDARLSDHKQKQERNLANLEVVRRLREATAAMAQVEQARKILIEEETELQALTRRVADDHTLVEAQRQAIAEIDQSTRAERDAIAAERGEIEQELAAARAQREAVAVRVPRSTLQKYDRIRGRRGSQAVFPLVGPSCGNCDTAIPLQRRNAMAATGSIELCEVCGVLLYAPEG